MDPLLLQLSNQSALTTNQCSLSASGEASFTEFTESCTLSSHAVFAAVAMVETARAESLGARYYMYLL